MINRYSFCISRQVELGSHEYSNRSKVPIGGKAPTCISVMCVILSLH